MPPTINKSFRLFDFHVYDERTDNSVKFIIQMFGINELGETCCFYVDDFQPFFYVLVPTHWTQEDAYDLLGELKKKVGNMAKDIISVELLQYNKLYGFTAGRKDQFVKFTFSNQGVKNKTANLWYQYD